MSLQHSIQKFWETAQAWIEHSDLDIRKVGLGVLITLVTGTTIHLVRSARRASNRSLVLIGKTRQKEDELSKQLGVDIESFLNTSNMLALTGIAPELKVDDKILLQDLNQKFPDFLITQLIHIDRLVKEGNKTQAIEILSHLRKHTPSSNPLCSLIPSDHDLDEASLPQMKLVEIVPNLVWRVTQYKLTVDAHGFIFRKKPDSNELVLVNAVHISSEIAEQVKSIGNVTEIVNNTKSHYMELLYCKSLFPQARLIGVTAHKTHPPCSSVQFDGFLNESNPVFPTDQFVEIQMNGHAMGETWILHVPSKSLVIGDFILSCSHGRSYPNLYMAEVGVLPLPNYDTCCANYAPILVEHVPKLKASLKKAFNAEFDRILLIHGPTIETNPRQVLKNAVGWVQDLGIAEQLFCVYRVMRERPQFVKAFWNVLTAKK